METAETLLGAFNEMRFHHSPGNMGTTKVGLKPYARQVITSRLVRAPFGAMLDKKVNNGLVLEGLCRIECRAAVGVGRI